MSKIFIDSNVWVYMFAEDGDARKRAAIDYIAEKSREGKLAISYQVVNEVTQVLKRKGCAEPVLREIIRNITGACDVVGFTPELALLASELREKNRFSFWDSHIVAAALSCGADILASEDMNDGQKIGNLTIKNIFV